MQKRNPNHWQGIDVSHWQGNIDWAKVRKAGVQFAFIKATEGKHYIDPLWKKNATEAAQAGIPKGYYHFARFNGEHTATAEAFHFINTIHSEESQLPYVLDLEVTNGLDRVALSRATKLFLDTVKLETNQQVMIYTNTNMARNHLIDILKDFPLWIAHYNVDQPGVNNIWNEWHVFQYSSKGKIPGIKGYVDLDEMMPIRQETSTKSKHAKENARIHVIRKGDTFWGLEKQNNWEHGTLQKLNPSANPNLLQIGQVINIP